MNKFHRAIDVRQAYAKLVAKSTGHPLRAVTAAGMTGQIPR